MGAPRGHDCAQVGTSRGYGAPPKVGLLEAPAGSKRCRLTAASYGSTAQQQHLVPALARRGRLPRARCTCWTFPLCHFRLPKIVKINEPCHGTGNVEACSAGRQSAGYLYTGQAGGRAGTAFTGGGGRRKRQATCALSSNLPASFHALLLSDRLFFVCCEAVGLTVQQDMQHSAITWHPGPISVTGALRHTTALFFGPPESCWLRCEAAHLLRLPPWRPFQQSQPPFCWLA